MVHNVPAAGSVLFKKHFQIAEDELTKLRERWQQYKQESNDAPSLFGLMEKDLDVIEMEELVTNMINHHFETNFVDFTLNTYFCQYSFKLCHDREGMKPSFEAFVPCDQDEVAKACHTPTIFEPLLLV